MSKTVEYRIVPIDRWMVIRFEATSDESGGSIGSTQCGEYPNEQTAETMGRMLAKADEAAFVSHRDHNHPKGGPIGSGGLSAA